MPHELHGCRMVQEGARGHAPPRAARPVGYGVGCGPEDWVPAIAVGERRELSQPPQVLLVDPGHGHLLLLVGLCSCGGGSCGGRLVGVELCLMLVGGLWLLMHVRLVVHVLRVVTLLGLLVGGGRPRLPFRHRQGRRECKRTSPFMCCCKHNAIGSPLAGVTLSVGGPCSRCACGVALCVDGCQQ